MSNKTVHPAEPPDELIRCFDEQGKEIEPHTRREIHQQPLKYWHAVTGVIVINEQLEILCSKRSPQLSQRPGVWQTNFGGHVNAGKTFEQNAMDELFAEAGILVRETDLHFLEIFKNPEFKHICKYYFCVFKGTLEDLYFSDGEITQVKWMNMERAWQERLAYPHKWAGGCPPERQEKIKLWTQQV